jgi:hypothetical protein
MPPTTNTKAHIAAKAKLETAKVELDRLRRERSHNPLASPGYSPLIGRAEIEVARCALALEGTAEQFNRAAPDLEGLRSFLLAELSIARKALDVPAPTPPTPPTEATGAVLKAYVDAQVAYGTAARAQRESQAPARQRLSLAYAAARDAQALIWKARAAAHEPAPTNVVVDNGPSDFSAPNTVDGIDQHIEALEAQRNPPQGQALSHLELRLRELEEDLVAFEEFEVRAAKSRREAFEAPPELQTSVWDGR